MTQKTDHGEAILSWQVPEYEKHERTRAWYIIAVLITVFLLLYSFFTSNFLFFGIVIISAMVIILHDGRDPDLVTFSLTHDGLIVGSKFYDYDELKDFSVIYKPRDGVRRLYFEFKNVIRPRLSISLEDQNPIKIRQELLKYLEEDLDRTDQPTSEGLANLLKL